MSPIGMMCQRGRNSYTAGEGRGFLHTESRPDLQVKVINFLKSKIFLKICMANDIILIAFQYYSSVGRLISGSSVYNKSYLVFCFCQKIMSVRFSFDKFYGMAH